MTQDEIKQVVRDMQTFVRGVERVWKEDGGRYPMLSTRIVITILNYNKFEADEILTYIHGNGFNYCLDPIFPSRLDDGETPTPEFACWWGVDQLRSRLACV